VFVVAEKGKLPVLLSTLMEEFAHPAARGVAPIPLFVKISWTWRMRDGGCEGRPRWKSDSLDYRDQHHDRPGRGDGRRAKRRVSGKPLQRTRDGSDLAFLYREFSATLIGVGGISSAEDAWHRMRAEPLYSCTPPWPYEGPYLRPLHQCSPCFT
jgi:hypothetical protein